MTDRIKQRLSSECLITDGAMGTYYREIYGGGRHVPELDNIENPQKIKAIHKAYIEAGAQLIRTNSFASNVSTLFRYDGKLTRVEILQRLYENVKASCRIAREAVEETGKTGEILIAGDIGPIPEHGQEDLKEEDLCEEYRTMVRVHLDAGADLIWFETFGDFDRIRPIVEWIRSFSDIMILASFSINMYGYTHSGVSAANLIAAAKEMKEIDGIGFNCGVGPSHLAGILKKLDFGDLIVFAAPNAGYADRIQNRNVYRDNLTYFADAMEEIAGLGVNLVGGCCGTSPAHIREVAKRCAHRPIPERLSYSPDKRSEDGLDYSRNPFMKRLYSGEKVVIAELDPPHDGKDAKMLRAAKILKQAGVEMITFSDSPMGRMRADSILSAVKVADRIQIDTMPHICCRDKNGIGLGAGILGAYMNGIRNFLIVTGDPVPTGDRDMVTSVYDFHSVTLMNYLDRMNKEQFREEPIAYGGALNYGRKNLEAEMRRMQKKCEAGASFFLTQPIYSEEDIERIRRIKSSVQTKIICGIMPLVSYRNALFMKNEITGIHVPDEIIARYDPDMSREEAAKIGVEISCEIAEKLWNIADGFYFMVPFNRAELIAEIMERLKKGEDKCCFDR